MSMKNSGDLIDLTVAGVDIGKYVFHLVGFDDDGKLMLGKKITRLTLDQTFEKLQEAGRTATYSLSGRYPDIFPDMPKHNSLENQHDDAAVGQPIEGF